jgi:AcrR family transcriptional regulator
LQGTESEKIIPIMDKRILKTKEKLQSALRILLEKKDVSDITVSSLCEVANINRSTFYVYYSNIQDCFEEITDSIMDEMRTLLQNNLNPSQEGFLLVYFRTARKYKNVFLAIHRQGVHNSTIQKMVDINNDWLHGELFIPTSSNRLEYNFIFSGFYGMVEMWLQNGCKESDEQLINILKKFYVVNR